MVHAVMVCVFVTVLIRIIAGLEKHVEFQHARAKPRKALTAMAKVHVSIKSRMENMRARVRPAFTVATAL